MIHRALPQSNIVTGDSLRIHDICHFFSPQTKMSAPHGRGTACVPVCLWQILVAWSTTNPFWPCAHKLSYDFDKRCKNVSFTCECCVVRNRAEIEIAKILHNLVEETGESGRFLKWKLESIFSPTLQSISEVANMEHLESPGEWFLLHTC